MFGWTPETEDGIDTLGLTTTIPELRAKYQRLKTAGVKPEMHDSASSGLKPKAVAGVDPKGNALPKAANAKLLSQKRPA